MPASQRPRNRAALQASHPHLLESLSPYVRASSYFATARTFDQVMRVIYDHALLYFRSGRGAFTIGGTSHEIAPGTLFFVRPGIEFGYGRSTAEPYYMLNMHFDPVQRSSSRQLTQSWGPPSLPSHARETAGDVIDDAPSGV